MAFGLTKENYYNSRRPHISASKIIDYTKDPYFYKLKHVDNKIIFELTEPMKLGKFVDALCTDPEEAKQYYVKTKRGEKDDYCLTETQWEEGILRAGEVNRQPFWAVHAGVEFQPILEAGLNKDGEVVPWKEGRGFVPLCGRPDRVDRLADGRVIITDLKCVNPMVVDSPRKWLWTAVERGYDIQFAMYRAMYARMHKIPVESISCYHLCVTSEDGFPRALLYKFPDKNLEAVDILWRQLAWKIKRKEFPRHTIENFDQALLCEAS